MPTLARWQPVAAVEGTGSMLIGPHDFGAQTLIPAGVIVTTPEGSDEEYSQGNGWRIAVWSPGFGVDGEGSRPATLEEVELRDAINLVRFEAPYQIDWFKGCVREMYQIARRMSELAETEEERQSAEALREQVVETLLDVALAFGDTWIREGVIS